MTRHGVAVVAVGAWLIVVAAPAQAAPAVKGVALGLYDVAPDSDATKTVGPRLDELVALGANSVEVVVHWRQTDVRADTIAADAAITLPDDRVREVCRAAKQRGLAVLLFPIVDVEKREVGKWRGTIAPKHVATWWTSYETFILHYAQLAADEDVTVFSIGSELGSTEAWKDRWFHLAGKVQAIYQGKLLYSANWDHYESVTFWERVDYVGVNAYWELTKDRDASEASLVKAWTPIREKLVAYAAKQNRPLVITEIGYTSQDGAAAHPWDYTNSAQVDVEEQRRAYQAFVDAWGDETALAGVYWWLWYGDGGDADKSYTPRGKPAEKVLRHFYGGDEKQ